MKGKQAEVERWFKAWLKVRQQGVVQADEFLLQVPARSRAEVRRLIHDHQELDEAFRQEGSRLAFQTGSVFGDYRLIRELGRGGTGSVWEAEQISLKRSVALKLLKPQFRFSPTTLQRFQREAEAGGRLQHVGIVQTYGVGETDDVHWIAQELVPGGFTLADSLAEMRQQQAPPDGYYREVAELFARIADALSHAHANGVVHRDLKPGNILLTEEEQPKVADFGLAHVQDDLVLSRTGDFLGTPFYMSPEQAAAKRMGLDHRTDLFSLGATLYEALTLVRAFDGDTSQQVFHKILTEEPLDPRRIRSRVPRDLAVICHKCLEKSPDRRYPGMTELAADLRRFLNDEPILAKPPGRVTRAVKWCRRHPVKSVTAAALLIGLPTISILGTWYVTHLDEVRAQQKAQLIREAEELGQRGFQALYEEFDPSKAQALFQQALATHPGMNPDDLAGLALAVAELQGPDAGIGVLHAHIAEWEAFPDLGRVEASILEMAAREQQAEQVLSALGEPKTGIGWSLEGRRRLAIGEKLGEPHGEESFAAAQHAFHQAILHVPVARIQDYLGMAHSMGHRRDPGPWLEPLVLAIEGLWPQDYVATLRRGFALGSGLSDRERWRTPEQAESAISAYRDTIRLDSETPFARINLGILLKVTGHLEEAEKELRRAIRTRPQDSIPHSELGNLLKETGRNEEAEEEYLESIRLDSEYAGVHNNLGNLLSATGRLKEAELAYREAIRLDQDYARAHANLGNLFAATNRQDEALEEYAESVQLDPDDSTVHMNLGILFHAVVRFEEAEKELREAIRLDPRSAPGHNALASLLFQIGRLEDAESEYQLAIHLDSGFALAHYNLASLMSDTDRDEDAEMELRESIRLDPQLADARGNLGLLLMKSARFNEAEAQFKEALRLDPENSNNHYNFGQLLFKTGHQEDAEAEYRSAIRLDPKRASPHTGLGLLYKAQGQLEKAEGEFREAIRLDSEDEVAHTNLAIQLQQTGRLAEAEAEYRLVIRFHPENSLAHQNLGILLRVTGRPKEAVAEYRAAIQIDPEEATVHYNLGNLLQAIGHLEEAETEFREVIRIEPKIAEAHCNLGHLLLDLHRPEEALEEFRQGHELGSPRSDWIYPSADWIRNAERAVEAAKRLELALADPEVVLDWNQAFSMARIAWSQGETEGASRLESRGIKLARDAQAVVNHELGMWTGASVDDLNSIAWALVDPTRPEKETDVVLALRLAQAAVAAAPDDGSIRDTLAWAMFENGRFDEALAEEEKAVELSAGAQRSELEQSLKDLQTKVEQAKASNKKAQDSHH